MVGLEGLELEGWQGEVVGRDGRDGGRKGRAGMVQFEG